MQGSHAWRGDSAVFDEDNLVSHAGLVPLLELAEQAGLSALLDEHVRFTSERVKSGAANPTPKLTSIIAGMAAGADSIDDLDVIRSGGMKKLFGGVYACATLGILLREFTHGHVRQLGSWPEADSQARAPSSDGPDARPAGTTGRCRLGGRARRRGQRGRMDQRCRLGCGGADQLPVPRQLLVAPPVFEVGQHGAVGGGWVEADPDERVIQDLCGAPAAV